MLYECFLQYGCVFVASGLDLPLLSTRRWGGQDIVLAILQVLLDDRWAPGNSQESLAPVDLSSLGPIAGGI